MRDGTPARTSLGFPLPGVARNLAMSVTVPTADNCSCISIDWASKRAGSGRVIGRAVEGAVSLFGVDSMRLEEYWESVSELVGASGS